MIPFTRPTYCGDEQHHISRAFNNKKLCGGGEYSLKCEEWFEKLIGCSKTFLTPSCTAALEMAAILIDIRPGDEVIMPSFTFVSTANAFVLRGAKIVFVDVKADDMNIDETLIEAAISPKTKAIVPVHYAGVGCNMPVIMKIAEKYGLYVIEDAAQGFLARQDDNYLGGIGHIGCMSFHETKNITAGGEGGLLILRDETFVKDAEIIREKGTNRSRFLRGQIDKYSWVNVGSSYLMSEIQAASLWSQLENADRIFNDRMALWLNYQRAFTDLHERCFIQTPKFGAQSHHNAHIFYIFLESFEIREQLISHLGRDNVQATFHYVPLHSSEAGRKFGRFFGEDVYSTNLSKKLLRLPLFNGMKPSETDLVIQSLKSFFQYEN